MMEQTSERKFTDKLIYILGGGALGAAIALGYILLSVGVVGLLLYVITLLHQLIVGG
ncbi:MAG: hypothetical protein HeimAB125_19520 [Candidatus Heimdallarchaeota archaeon AB_125]|nr:MAG: hypothetical protein HeimAB125_19520 [Candidatus Heimdallarchaeota archaeon AB_125]